MNKEIEDSLKDVMTGLEEMHNELTKIDNWGLVRKCEKMQLDLIKVTAHLKLDEDKDE